MVGPGSSERQKEIARLLADNPRTSVARLGKVLGVSTVTIRSDLNEMAGSGVLIRTRGGALPAFHPSILERQKRHVEEKVRIARAAAAMIQDGDEVMIVAGTTTASIPRFLLGKRDVKIVTNSTLMMPYVRVNPNLQLTMVGGEFRPAAEALVGPNTLGDLSQFHVSKAFLGTDGFTLEKGITADSVEIAEVVRKMAEQARELILLADASKLGRAGFAHIMEAERINVLITDASIDRQQAVRFEERGIRVVAV
jgi:DeoR family galactitol utilization operon repressor